MRINVDEVGMISGSRSNAIVVLVLAVLIACTSEKGSGEISGFGFKAIELNSGQEKEIPLILNTTEQVKGIEFMLEWDPAQIRVKTPELLPGNESFSVHARAYGDNQMKVLLFSMQSAVLTPMASGILRVPVEPVNEFEGDTQLKIINTVFAGPNATSYDIPVEFGIITVR
jgi:hypothetical protein